MFLFIGVCFRIITFGFIDLILYFIIQTIASLNIFVFYTLSLERFFLISLLFKLSIFPFLFWYLPVFKKLPNFVFYIASSFHKLPTFIMVNKFIYIYNINIISLSITLTLLLSGVLIFSINNARFIIIMSSVGNNSWLFLASMQTLDIFYIYFLIYITNTIIILIFFSNFFTLPNFNSLNSVLLFLFLLLSLAGFPPFPLFYVKLLVVSNLVSSATFSSIYLFTLLLRAIVIMAAYFRFSLSLLINVYRRINRFILY